MMINEQTSEIKIAERIILFDGVCNYCNTMVNFVIRRDRKDRFRFAPLQSPAGEALRLQYQIAPGVDSLVYIENGRAFIYGTAVCRICRQMPGLWPVFSAGLLIPRFIRDGLYRWFARHRYRWFGRTAHCMVPTPDVRAKFLQ